MTPVAEKLRPVGPTGPRGARAGARRPLRRLRTYFVPDSTTRHGPTSTIKRGPNAAQRAFTGDTLGGRFTRSLVADTTAPAFRMPELAERPSVLERARTAVRAEAQQAATTEERADRLMLAIGLSFLTIGICLVLFVAYTFMFTGLQQQREQHALLNEFLGPDAHNLYSNRVPAEGQPVGVLVIPSIGVKQVVVEGSNAADTAKGPGVMIGTARPGTQGNSVIVGRRSTSGAPFAHLLDLRPGDAITMVTGLGTFHYTIDQVGTATAGQRDPISPTTGARMTLVTSNAPVIPTGRDYAIAKLTSAPAHAPVPAMLAPSSQRGLSGDSAAILPSLFWGLVFAASLAVTFIAYRRATRQVWTVYLLSTPIVLALALEWFSNLYLLLPPTL